ncbi:hypothetical protein PsYK624_133330 [Phanerochaete sordida]|uniref:Uncharacterized protein n=1 Tax=Phanerochaete sordida TaxID=48140 RepID=A0A9P3LKC9_9APHY|nr:hypothetical protein PsYK624_133330 [Phanerochaete sordida]
MIIAQLPHLRVELTAREYKNAMASVSLVCSAFRKEGQKGLFRCILYDGSVEADAPILGARAFWHSLLREGDGNAQRLAAYVRECTLLCGPTDYSEHDVWVTDIMATLASFHQVETVNMEYMHVDGRLLAILAGMPLLHTVTLDGCLSLHSESTIVTPPPGRSSWTHITLRGSYLSHLWAEFFRKVVDVDRLESLYVDDWVVCDRLFQEAIFPSLKKFGIFVQGVHYVLPQLISVLRRIPMVEQLSLHLHQPSSRQLHLQPLSLQLLPHVRHLTTTTTQFASWLLPGRSITSLAITRHDGDVSDEHFQSAIRASQAHIRELSIPLDLVSTLRQHDWPELQTLKIQAPVTPHHPFLRWMDLALPEPIYTVTTLVCQLNLVFQENKGASPQLRSQKAEILDRLVPAFPNAVQCSFGEAIQWRREEAGEWHPRVLSRPRLVEALYKGFEEVEDVDGFLAAFRAANPLCTEYQGYSEPR